jgi:hypothetical protein
MCDSAEPALLALLQLLLLDGVCNMAVWRLVRGRNGKEEKQQISADSTMNELCPWPRMHLILTWGYVLESLWELINIWRIRQGLEPLPPLGQVWGLVPDRMWKEYLDLRQRHLTNMPAVLLSFLLLAQDVFAPLGHNLELIKTLRTLCLHTLQGDGQHIVH